MTTRGILWGIVCALMALPALAGERETRGGFIHEIKVGAQAHDIPYMWSGFHKEPYSVDLNLEAQFSAHVVLWRGAIRPMIGTTINFDGNTSKAYAGARWQWERPSSNMFFALGLAVAVHNGETFSSDPEDKQLGRRVLFHDSIELGYRFDAHRSVSLFYEHISNASTADKNQGLDTLGVRYGYRF
jgi:lipid A 3-O-deacylase